MNEYEQLQKYRENEAFLAHQHFQYSSFFIKILSSLLILPIMRFRYTTRPLRNGPITIAIRARFDYDSATTRYEMRTIRLRFEYDTTSYEELCAFEQ